MADMLRTGAAWLEAQRKAHMTTDVIYTHQRVPGAVSTTVAATFGRTDYEVSTDEMTIGSHVWDFLITAADLSAEPEAGDIITAQGRRYIVMRIAGEAWRWSDAFRTTYRIHTRDTGSSETGVS